MTVSLAAAVALLGAWLATRGLPVLAWTGAATDGLTADRASWTLASLPPVQGGVGRLAASGVWLVVMLAAVACAAGMIAWRIARDAPAVGSVGTTLLAAGTALAWAASTGVVSSFVDGAHATLLPAIALALAYLVALPTASWRLRILLLAGAVALDPLAGFVVALAAALPTARPGQGRVRPGIVEWIIGGAGLASAVAWAITAGADDLAARLASAPALLGSLSSPVSAVDAVTVGGGSVAIGAVVLAVLAGVAGVVGGGARPAVAVAVVLLVALAIDAIVATDGVLLARTLTIALAAVGPYVVCLALRSGAATRPPTPADGPPGVVSQAAAAAAPRPATRAGWAAAVVGLVLTGAVAVAAIGTSARAGALDAFDPADDPLGWMAVSVGDRVAPSAIDLARLTALAARAGRDGFDLARALVRWGTVADEAERWSVAALDGDARVSQGGGTEGARRARIGLIAAEAHVAQVWAAHRVIVGREGRDLPVQVRLPAGYRWPIQRVPTRGASGEQEVEPYPVMYARHVAGFTSARLAVRQGYEASARVDARAIQAQARLETHRLALLAALPRVMREDAYDAIARFVPASLIGEVVGRVSVPIDSLPVEERLEVEAALDAAAGQEKAEAEVANDGSGEGDDARVSRVVVRLDVLAKWVAATVAREVPAVPGLEPLQAVLLMAGGFEADAFSRIDTATDGSSAAVRVARAQLLFARFNREAARATEADLPRAERRTAAAAAQAAWEQTGALLEPLVAAPTRAMLEGAPRRAVLAAMRLDAMRFQFGPAGVRPQQALARWEALLEAHAPHVLRRTTDAEGNAVPIFRPGSGARDAHFLAGNVLFAEDRLDVAIIHFVDELKRDPQHTLARLELGRLQFAAARSEYRELLREYTEVYATLPFADRDARVDGLPTIPLWELARAFARTGNQRFVQRLEQMTRKIDAAYATDPRNPAVRDLYATVYFFRGDARWALQDIALAERFMRQAYRAAPDLALDIRGQQLDDRLGRFYAEVWRQYVDDPTATDDPEEQLALEDLLTRALRLSQSVRDQLYERVKAIIAENTDPDAEYETPELRPFYRIAAEIYPEWAPAQHWLARFARRQGEWETAQSHYLRALDAIETEEPAMWKLVVLEVAQFQLMRALSYVAEYERALAGPRRDGFVRQAWEAFDRAHHWSREAYRYDPSDAVWQTIASLDNERYIFAKKVGDPRAMDFLADAIGAFQETLMPREPSANMQVLTALMAQQILALRLGNAPADAVLASADAYVAWVPRPTAYVLDLRARLIVDRVVVQARALVAGGDLVGAIGQLESTVAIARDSSLLRLSLGEAYEAAGRLGDAEEAYRTAIGLDRAELMAGFRLGLLIAGEPRVERRAEALRALDRFARSVDRLDTQDVTVELALAKQQAIARRDAMWARHLQVGEAARQFVADGAWEAALPLLEEVYFTNPAALVLSSGYLPILEVARELGQPAVQVRWSLRALRFDPDATEHETAAYRDALLAGLRALPAGATVDLRDLPMLIRATHVVRLRDLAEGNGLQPPGPDPRGRAIAHEADDNHALLRVDAHALADAMSRGDG